MGPRKDFLLVNPKHKQEVLAWFLRYATEDASLTRRLAKLFSFLVEGKSIMRETAATHCEVAEMLARRLGFSEAVQKAVRFTWEQWDGKGLVYGRRGHETPSAARILHLAQVLVAAYDFGGSTLAISLAKERRGQEFDPELVDIFLRLSKRRDFWKVFEQESVQRTVLAMKPPASLDAITVDQVDTVCEVLADFTDIRSRQTWHHSEEVATIAVEIGHHLGLQSEEITKVRRAALVHDLGKVAVPSGILGRQEQLSETEWERFRLHPYYTERILTRVGPLRDLVPAAAAHHEWMNGHGYHRQLLGEEIPLGGRILAAANIYVLIKQQDEARDSVAALRRMHALVGTQLDGTCYEALVAALRGSAVQDRLSLPAQRPGSLTEREVEVLQELAKGLSNRQIAKNLFISEKTVEHHLDHIYGKLGVTSRTSAVVYAVHNGLVR